MTTECWYAIDLREIANRIMEVCAEPTEPIILPPSAKGLCIFLEITPGTIVELLLSRSDVDFINNVFKVKETLQEGGYVTD